MKVTTAQTLAPPQDNNREQQQETTTGNNNRKQQQETTTGNNNKHNSKIQPWLTVEEGHHSTNINTTAEKSISG
jgi:hypothetical protein